MIALDGPRFSGVLRQADDGPLSQPAGTVEPGLCLPTRGYRARRTGLPTHSRFANIDEAVGNILVQALIPITLEVALAVQQELQSRVEEAGRLRQQQVKRSRYEAELARRRYLRVDHDNRLVADSLEADWNGKLKMLAEAQEICERQREQDRKVVSDQTTSSNPFACRQFPATVA